MSPDDIIVVQGVVSILAVLVFGVMAQVYRVQRDTAIDQAHAGYEWIDEIIAALEEEDEVAGNAAVDRLVAQRVSDGGTVSD